MPVTSKASIARGEAGGRSGGHRSLEMVDRFNPASSNRQGLSPGRSKNMRFRIRTIMIAVVIVGLVTAWAVVWWRAREEIRRAHLEMQMAREVAEDRAFGRASSQGCRGSREVGRARSRGTPSEVVPRRRRSGHEPEAAHSAAIRAALSQVGFTNAVRPTDPGGMKASRLGRRVARLDVSLASGAILNAACRGGPKTLGRPRYSHHSWCLGMIIRDARRAGPHAELIFLTATLEAGESRCCARRL